ncbi:DNA polymerase III subunit delta' [Thalassolituus sp. LLYu03]|uniref:DNA polymerase III subunit delta' n=1 Tax=Thalassolituus sp. LLYu03 TaxID=3421656 RepID=UPI003D2B7D7D
MTELLPWQAGAWTELVKRHRKAGLPHALLFTGLAGIGKHQLARYTAKWLLCLRDEDQPCGQCHSCHLWEAGSHPDYLLAQPEEGSKQVRIDTVRRVNEFLSQTPQISRCQVVGLRPVEVMNTNAANALLKTLEEPAGESFLLLETERFGSVLPTIRSRCQRFVLETPPEAAALGWLSAQGHAAATAAQALRRNHGAPLRANDWLRADQAGQQQRLLELLVQWSRGAAPLQATADGWSKLELSDVTHWFYGFLSDCIKVSMGVPADTLTFGNEVSLVLGGATPSAAKLIPLHDKVKEILGRLLSGAGHYNKQLLIESLLIEWQALLYDRQ